MDPRGRARFGFNVENFLRNSLPIFIKPFRFINHDFNDLLSDSVIGSLVSIYSLLHFSYLKDFKDNGY